MPGGAVSSGGAGLVRSCPVGLQPGAGPLFLHPQWLAYPPRTRFYPLSCPHQRLEFLPRQSHVLVLWASRWCGGGS